MQSLNISTSALRALQTALDNTANNLANIDTVGFKRREGSFSELLADSMNEQPKADGGRTSPPGLRVGSGAKVGLTKLDMSQGSMKITDVPTDLMIDGDGFFLVRHMIRDANGNLRDGYRLTRNGAFSLQEVPGQRDRYRLFTANGDPLVDGTGSEVNIDDPDQLLKKGEKLKVEPDGRITLGGNTVAEIPVWRAAAPDLLNQVGNGEWEIAIPANEQPDNVLERSDAAIRQGALEMSNVDLREEMSRLIMVQRAYQLNSRAIAISDQMMGIANSLRSR